MEVTPILGLVKGAREFQESGESLNPRLGWAFEAPQEAINLLVVSQFEIAGRLLLLAGEDIFNLRLHSGEVLLSPAYVVW